MAWSATDPPDPTRRRAVASAIALGAFFGVIVVGLAILAAAAAIGVARDALPVEPTDDDGLLSDCDQENDFVMDLGSCAPVLEAQEFADGSAVAEILGAGPRNFEYAITNNTDKLRSYDHRLVTVLEPSSAVTDCWGDDSAHRYPVYPGERSVAYGGCIVEGEPEPGVYQLMYEGVPVASIEVPG